MVALNGSDAGAWKRDILCVREGIPSPRLGTRKPDASLPYRNALESKPLDLEVFDPTLTQLIRGTY